MQKEPNCTDKDSYKSVKNSHAGKLRHMFNLFPFGICYVTFTSIITHCETKQKDLKKIFFLPFFLFLMCTYWNAGEGNWRRLPRDAKATAIGSEFC